MNKFICRSLAVFALSSGMATTCFGADESGNYAIWGAGAQSCHQYATAADQKEKLARFRDFLMGYLTAYNTVTENTHNALGEMSFAQATDWRDDSCDMNKLDSFERAIGQLLVSRGEDKPAASSGSWGRAPTPK